MANNYRITDYENNTIGTASTLEDARKKAAKALMGTLNGRWVHISKNGHEFATVTFHRADRFTNGRITRAYEYLCKQLVIKSSGHYYWDYYRFSPKTGRNTGKIAYGSQYF